MKIVLVKNSNDRAIGYNIEPETLEEKEIVGTVRDMIFFGFDDTELKYDGLELVEGGVKRPEDLVRLKFLQKKHQTH